MGITIIVPKSGSRNSNYIVKKPIEHKGKKYHPGDTVSVTGRDNQANFYFSGCIDNNDKKKHSLDKRS